MLRFLVVVGFAYSVGLTAYGPADQMKKLEGTWAVDTATADGKPAEQMKGGRAVFAGDKLTLRGANGLEEKFTYKIDPSQTPKTMDFVPQKKEKNTAAGKAIYQLDGDILKICLGPPDKRPTEFNDKGQILMIFKRQR